jgi:hypothetical protein
MRVLASEDRQDFQEDTAQGKDVCRSTSRLEIVYFWGAVTGCQGCASICLTVALGGVVTGQSKISNVYPPPAPVLMNEVFPDQNILWLDVHMLCRMFVNKTECRGKATEDSREKLISRSCVRRISDL